MQAPGRSRWEAVRERRRKWAGLRYLVFASRGTVVVGRPGGAGRLAMGNKLRGNAIDGRDGWSWVSSWRPSTGRAVEAGNLRCSTATGSPEKAMLQAPSQSGAARRTHGLRRSRRQGGQAAGPDKISLFCGWDHAEKKSSASRRAEKAACQFPASASALSLAST